MVVAMATKGSQAVQAAQLTDSLVDHVRSSARRSLHGPGRVVVKEFTLGPQGSPRADVYAVDVSYTSESTIYELKVARSDFKRDVGAGKYQAYLKFCHRLYFATPKGLVTRAEIPADAGLIEWNGQGWRAAKGAPKVGNGQVPLLQLLWRMVEVQDFETSRLRRLRLRQDVEIRTLAQNVGRELGLLNRWQRSDREYIETVKKQIEKLLGKSFKEPSDAITELNSFVKRERTLVNQRYGTPLQLADELEGLAKEMRNG